MIIAPNTQNEDARLEELSDLDILDTLPEQAYDDITFLASRICNAPIAVISFIDTDRQWFKSRVGLDVAETSRDLAFCAHAILEPTEMLIVPDAQKDRRFSGNPLVTDHPSLRFYAGAPLVTSTGNALGTLCVLDTEPRQLNDEQIRSLEALSRQVMAQLELRRSVVELHEKAAEQQVYEKQLEIYQQKLEKNLDTIRQLSLTDPLTGLRNRRALMDKLAEECLRMARYNAELSFAIIDVDGFKPYNDEKGHPAGDVVLERVAQLIQSESRSTDLVARYGGDEFAVVFCDTGIEGAQVLAERIRRTVEQTEWPDGDMTVSIGVATGDPAISDPDHLIDSADRALYSAKRAGRNQVAMTVSV